MAPAAILCIPVYVKATIIIMTEMATNVESGSSSMTKHKRKLPCHRITLFAAAAATATIAFFLPSV